jgi:NADPH-dependent 2,4-dienoyl-CoA reductase/sulfur reductase-like enzyme
MVDGHMRTNIPNIFAAGDIAEIEIDGLKKVNPVHINAVKTGAVAGSNMAGIERTLPEHIEDMNLVTLFDMPFLSIGVQKGGRMLKRDGKNGMVKIYRDDGGIISGVQMVRDVRRGGVYLSMMRRRVPVTEKMDILSPRFNYGMTAWTF